LYWTNTSLKTAFASCLLSLLLSVVEGQMYEPDNEPYVLNSGKYGCFEFFGEFIYWKTCLDDLDFAAELTDLSEIQSEDSYRQQIDYHNLSPGWEPGFRLGFAIEDIWCEWRLSGSYTHIEVRDSADHTRQEKNILISPFHFSGFTNPNKEQRNADIGFTEIKGKIAVTYRTWDALLSRAICSSECYVIAPFIGVEGLHLDQKIRTHSWTLSIPETETEDPAPILQIDGSAVTRWNSELCAYGLKFGTDYIYRLGSCIKLFSRGSFTIAAGDRHAKNQQTLVLSTREGDLQPKQSITAKDDDSCLFVNGYHIQCGFIYETELCNTNFASRIGYEFVKWHNVPRPRRFPGGEQNVEFYNRALSTSPGQSTLGFHGIMAGISVEF